MGAVVQPTTEGEVGEEPPSRVELWLQVLGGGCREGRPAKEAAGGDEIEGRRKSVKAGDSASDLPADSSGRLRPSGTEGRSVLSPVPGTESLDFPEL